MGSCRTGGPILIATKAMLLTGQDTRLGELRRFSGLRPPGDQGGENDWTLQGALSLNVRQKSGQ